MMATMFEGKMNYMCMIPNGEFKMDNGNSLKLYKILLQDREDLQLHEFYTTEKNETLLELVGTLKPMDTVAAVIALEYDKYKKRSKWAIRELHAM